MTCFHPMEVWRCRNLDDKRFSILFSEKKASRFDFSERIKIPCGQCIGCRDDRAMQWAIRCTHEASLYSKNCFITLTYDDDYMPKNYGIDISWIQRFNKRLRKKYRECKIRTFYCAEYGSKPVMVGSPLGRPHFHEILFNFDFPDKYFWSYSPNGKPIYRSPTLEELWPYGFSTIQDMSYGAARYCARYALKKINGKLRDEYYMDPRTGEIRNQEVCKASNRPGIGYEWIKKFKNDVYPDDFIVMENGYKAHPPRYYDKVFDLFDHDSFMDIKDTRQCRAAEYAENNTPERLAVREEVFRSRLRERKRS